MDVTCQHERVVTGTCDCDISTLRGLLQVLVGVTCHLFLTNKNVQIFILKL